MIMTGAQKYTQNAARMSEISKILFSTVYVTKL